MACAPSEDSDQPEDPAHVDLSLCGQACKLYDYCILDAKE